jgi:hypothetical protein
MKAFYFAVPDLSFGNGSGKASPRENRARGLNARFGCETACSSRPFGYAQCNAPLDNQGFSDRHYSVLPEDLDPG